MKRNAEVDIEEAVEAKRSRRQEIIQRQIENTRADRARITLSPVFDEWLKKEIP